MKFSINVDIEHSDRSPFETAVLVQEALVAHLGEGVTVHTSASDLETIIWTHRQELAAGINLDRGRGSAVHLAILDRAGYGS